MSSRNESAGDQLGPSWLGDVQDLEAFLISHESIAELHPHCVRILEPLSKFPDEHRCFERVITQAKDKKAVAPHDIEIGSGHKGMHGSS